MPNDFNEFFPRGDFRGYEEALAAHYKAGRRPGLTPRHRQNYMFTSEHPLDGNGNPYPAFTDYKYDVSAKFRTELGLSLWRTVPLLPVQPHEWPAEYVYEKVYKRRAALVELPSRMYAVEDGLREVIERLEPGVHQFHPIRMILPEGIEHPIQHHMMVVGRWLSSFRLAQTDPGCLRDAETVSPIVHSDTKECIAGVAMDSVEIGSAHLWCERYVRGPKFLISDLLKDEIIKAGLRLPPHFKMKSV